MSAVMKTEVRSTHWLGLEPDCHGHELMLEWAPYRRGGSRLGAPNRVGGGWSEPLDKARDEEPAWLVLVDHALAPIYRKHIVYERMVKLYYLDELALWDVAEKCQRSPGFVGLSLRGICSQVDARVSS